MLVTLILDAARLHAWHLTLLDQLAAHPGVRPAVAFAAKSQPLAAVIRLGLRLEAIANPNHAHPAFAPLTPAAFAAFAAPPDAATSVVIDLAASHFALPSATMAAPKTLTPLYDGSPGEPAFWTALLAGHAPVLALHDSAASTITAVALPAIERPLALSRSAAQVVTRLISILGKSAANPAGALAPLEIPPPRSDLKTPSLLLAGKIAAYAGRSIRNATVAGPDWKVAWRHRPGPIGLPDPAPLDLANFHILDDGGDRFYADPFLFAHDGRIDLFVEDFPSSTARGVISVCQLNSGSSATSPRPVLEAPFHLSYPQVFARDGEIWMLPEASGSGALTLYRACPYPSAWQPAATLIGEPLHDATIFEHSGRLWIAASAEGPASARWGSSWDSLNLYSAGTLLGPWSPHPGNPVLIDGRSARPAGGVFTLAGKLYRPVQDCSSYYGSVLGIAEITCLNAETFTQRTVSAHAFPPRSRLLGPHTLSRIPVPGGHIEAIDVYGRLADLRAAGGNL